MEEGDRVSSVVDYEGAGFCKSADIETVNDDDEEESYDVSLKSISVEKPPEKKLMTLKTVKNSPSNNHLNIIKIEDLKKVTRSG